MEKKTFEELVFKDGIRLGDSPYDPTKLTIDIGTDAAFDELFSSATYNKIKNHWHGGSLTEANPANGMIESVVAGSKLRHRSGGGWDEVLQLTRSADVSPQFATLRIMDTGADHYLDIKCSENLSGNRFLNIQVGDATRTVSIAGDVNLNDWFNQSVKTTASPLFDHLGLGGVAVDADIGINFDEVMTDVDNSVKASIYSILQVTKIMAADMVSIAYGVNMLCTLDSTNTQNWTNVAGLRGIQGYIITEAGSAGTVTGAACLITSATIADAATVTNLYGLYISTPAVAGNKVTNEYGIYIANQNTGQTLNYAIYTNTGLVHFGDDITVVGDITANHLGLGGAAVDADIGINFSEVLTDVDNSVKAGVYSYLQVAKTTAVMTAQGIGVSIECNLDSSNTQNWTNAIGLIGLASIIVSEAGSAGTITGAAALTTYANFADAATITNYYGLYTSGASVAGNKLTNLYGIYIADQNTGLTLNYAIYTNAGVVRFGDIVFINETANTRMTTGLTINQGAADERNRKYKDDYWTYNKPGSCGR